MSAVTKSIGSRERHEVTPELIPLAFGSFRRSLRWHDLKEVGNPVMAPKNWHNDVELETWVKRVCKISHNRLLPRRRANAKVFKTHTGTF